LETIEIKYKTNFIAQNKTIVFSKNTLLVYRNNILVHQINEDEIEGIRYGIKWIKGSHLTIGRVYCIDLLDSNNKEYNIKLQSLYGINIENLNTKYNKIINLLYEYFFIGKIENYILKINNGEDLKISDVVFNNLGIQIEFKSKVCFIEWENIDLKTTFEKITLISKENREIHKDFNFLLDWNAVIIFGICKLILLDKGLIEN
jgi:hypothetical protein